MKIVKLRAQKADHLTEEVDSFKRDFRVREVTYVDKNDYLIAFVEYEYKSYPDNVKIESLDLSTRLYNCLMRDGNIETLGELKHYFLTGDIRRIRNLGKLCIKEVAELLSEKYNTNYSQFIDSILESYINIDYTRYIKENIPFYW